MKKYVLLLIFITFGMLTYSKPQQSTPKPIQEATPTIWFAQAGAEGSGSMAESPLGTTAEIEASTKPGDLIILLPGNQAFEGGLELKEKQTLIGTSDNGIKPVITNRDTLRNGGNGILLADNNRIEGIHIENTAASGLFGSSVSGTRISGVVIDSANQLGLYTQAMLKAMQGPVPHGGITLINTHPKSFAHHSIMDSEIINSTAFGINSFALNSAAMKLTITRTEVAKGDSLGLADVGIGAFAEGRASEVQLDVIDSSVQERMSIIGRNVIAFASAGGSVGVQFDRSYCGISGQDGIIGNVALLPAKVAIDISNSMIEHAAQMNLEGTLLHSPHVDSSRVSENLVSIDIENSTIRNAGTVRGYINESRNIWMGMTPMRTVMQQEDLSSSLFPVGNYRLNIRNSTVNGAKDYGIGLGMPHSTPEPGNFEILLRNNRIMRNGAYELVLSAPNIEVDARKNCWGTANGFPSGKLKLEGGAKRSNLVVSEPLECSKKILE